MSFWIAAFLLIPLADQAIKAQLRQRLGDRVVSLGPLGSVRVIYAPVWWARCRFRPTRTRLRLPVPALLAGIQPSRRRNLDRHRRLHRPSDLRIWSIFCIEMSLPSPASRADDGPGYPRYFRIAGKWINSFKVFLCVGIYVGILVIAAVAQSSGIPPLRVGLGSLALAIIGLGGARLYHLLVYHPRYFGRNASQSVWNS